MLLILYNYDDGKIPTSVFLIRDGNILNHIFLVLLFLAFNSSDNFLMFFSCLDIIILLRIEKIKKNPFEDISVLIITFYLTP